LRWRKYITMKNRETLTAWLLLGPALVGFLIFYIIPFAESVWYSLLSDMFSRRFVGLDNYARLLGNPTFLTGMGNTLLFILMGVPLSAGGALVLALMFKRVTSGATFFKTAVLAALVLPASSVAVVWNIFFSQTGALNGIIVSFGGEAANWIGSSYARMVVMLLYLWRNIGYNMIIFTAGLAAIPREYYEISRIEGAGAWQNFYYVTLPCLKESLFFVLIMSIMGGFKVFREVYAISGAYPHESIYMLQNFMNNLFSRLDYQSLCASAVMTVMIILVPVWFYIRSGKEEV
jgi:multiple sugar transport system permease protein